MEGLKDEGPLESALAGPPKNTVPPFIFASASVLSRKYDSLYISPFALEVIQHCRASTFMWISFFRSAGIKYVPYAYEVTEIGTRS